MAIVPRTIRLKFRDTAPMGLNTGQIVPGSVLVAGLQPADYELGHTGADGALVVGSPITVIRALAPHGDTLYAVTFTYDDALPPFTNPFDNPKATLDAWQTAIVTDTAALVSGRAGVAALNPASITNIATAVTFETAEKAALLAELDALHATLNDVKAAINALAGVVVTLRSNLPPST